MPKGDETKRDYETLGLEHSATEDDVKRSFMKLALKFHPDLYARPTCDEVSRSKYHEVCQAFKRIITGDRTISEWNSDKSDEIFFSLLRETLQATLKSGSLYSLFSTLPNHKTHFQDDNEYRCQEDVMDDESEETDFNKLLDILKNRLQNGKSVPAGLTKEKISKLKEEFVKQKDANKKLAVEKCGAVCKKTKITTVPVTKPKPKTKKQLLAEQRRREKEMAKIAAELEEKKKKESEKDNMKKQLEAEKQRKIDEEFKKQEEERKKEILEAKKKKEREDKEKEARLQKERDRQEKLKKQQEEEQRRKEEEKKRKAEEKAAKAKSIKEAKDKEEKEKSEQAKKAQQAKRQQQYQQYQQQQQKYPREVPPRFLRQQQLKQHQGLSQSQEQLTDPGTTKQATKRKDVPDQLSGKVTAPSSQRNELNDYVGQTWTETDANAGESWGQEISKDSEPESSWGGVPVSDDWDATLTGKLDKEVVSSLSDFGDPTSTTKSVDDVRTAEPSPIGSEVKQGKIQKKDAGLKGSDPALTTPYSRSGVFGAVGERLANTSQLPLTTDDKVTSGAGQGSLEQVVMNTSDASSERGVFEYTQTCTKEGNKQLIGNVPPKTSEVAGGTNTWNKAPCRPKVTATTLSTESANSVGPKLTEWSGLDVFEPVPSGVIDEAQVDKGTFSNLSRDSKSTHVNSIPSHGDHLVQSKQLTNSVQSHTNMQGLSPNEIKKDLSPGLVCSENNQVTKASHGDSLDQLSSFNIPQSTEKLQAKTGPPRTGDDEGEEYGWTTASRKAKKNLTSNVPPSKDANAWVSRSLKQLVDMGFQREDAERALKDNNGIIESAVSDLLAGGDGKSKETTATKPGTTYGLAPVKSQSITVVSSASVVAQGTAGTGQPKLNRKQRRKLMQQQDQSGSQFSNDPSLGGEWKLVTRDKSSHSTANALLDDFASTKVISKNDASYSRVLGQSSTKPEVARVVGTATNSGNVHGSPAGPNSGFSSSIGSELSKSLPVLTDGIASNSKGDSAHISSQPTSRSASPRSSGSRSPSLNYHASGMPSSVLNNLPFKSLSSDPIQQKLSSNSAISSANHLFYSDPQLLQQHPASQAPTHRAISQGLLQGTPSSTVASIGNQNGLPHAPLLQSSLMQHILQPQSNLVSNTIAGKAQENMKPDFSIPPNDLTKTAQHIGPDSTSIASLARQQAPTGPLGFGNPLLAGTIPFSSAPQQSKLHQWKQPILSDMTNVQDVSETAAKMQAPPQGVNVTSVTNTSGSVTAPVTIDPVSAKWGVVAAPRLSPTPSEFKPGVPWKPRSEVEREAREKANEREMPLAPSPSSENLSPSETTPADSGEVAPNSSAASTDSRHFRPVEAASNQPTDAVRPPPGLTESYAFQSIPVKSMGTTLPKEVSPEAPSLKWIILKGVGEKVDPSSLRSLCQKYGPVADFQVGVNSVCVCFETPKQAGDACKAFNGKFIFDSHFTAELASDDAISSTFHAKSWSCTPESSSTPVDPMVNLNQQLTGLWVTPTPLNPEPPCVVGPSGLAGPIPVNMFGIPPPITQWSGVATDPTRGSAPFWPVQPGHFIPPVPLGPINLPPQPVTGTGSVVSPSMTKFLPDGLFNGSEST